MSDSDNDFIDDDELPTRGSRAKKRTRAAWEASIHERENPLIGEQTGVGLIEELAWKAEAKKRERLVLSVGCMDPDWLEEARTMRIGGDGGDWSWAFAEVLQIHGMKLTLRRSKYHSPHDISFNFRSISLNIWQECRIYLPEIERYRS